MKVELSPRERQLVRDAIEDSLYRLRYDKKVKENKYYRNAMKRLKQTFESFEKDYLKNVRSSDSGENKG